MSIKLPLLIVSFFLIHPVTAFSKTMPSSSSSASSLPIKAPQPLRLRGIIPPLVTPLLLLTPDNDDDACSGAPPPSILKIDEEGTRRLIEHVLAPGGVTGGIFVLGSTGEGPSLPHALRHDFVKLCCSIVANRVPVLVGIADTCFQVTVELAQTAAAAGATAVVLMAPYYFPMAQTDLLRYVDRVLEQCSLPVLIYNIPQLMKVVWEIKTLRELAKQHKAIIGVKDSSRDLDYFQQLCQLKLRERPDWSILIGPEQYTAQAVLEWGADGGINGGANVEPKLFQSL